MSMAASPPASDEVPSKGPVVVMGVSGCGKSSVGVRLADLLGCPFVEGDILHPSGNIEKMRKGIPLDDADRWPWLELIGQRLASENIVVSCSALRRCYREALRRAAGRRLTFVYLAGYRELLDRRLTQRRHEYMPASLLDSQLATLEDPTGEDGVLRLEITGLPEAIAAAAADRITALQARHQ